MKKETTAAYDLQRFVLAQQPVYATALSELKAGREKTHWIWFVSPQVEGLGKSEMSQRYAPFHSHASSGFHYLSTYVRADGLLDRFVNESEFKRFPSGGHRRLRRRDGSTAQHRGPSTKRLLARLKQTAADAPKAARRCRRRRSRRFALTRRLSPRFRRCLGGCRGAAH
jgi:hypothetical protein